VVPPTATEKQKEEGGVPLGLTAKGEGPGSGKEEGEKRRRITPNSGKESANTIGIKRKSASNCLNEQGGKREAH